MPADPYRAVAALVRADAARHSPAPTATATPPPATAHGRTEPNAATSALTEGPRRFGLLRTALAALRSPLRRPRPHRPFRRPR